MTRTLLLGCLAAAALAQEEPRRSERGPWQNDLWIARRVERWQEPRVFVEAAGVPSATVMADGRLIAAFQWFPSDRPDDFDRVAVCFSEDLGETWSAPTPIVIDLPEGYQRPFDPTLALLEDGRLRLYFTSNPRDVRLLDGRTAIYSAVSEDGVTWSFEPGARFAVEGHRVIDCAVARAGGVWHLTAPIGAPHEGAYHAVSEDGLSFRRSEDIPSSSEINWTGNLLADEGGLRFFGCAGRLGIWHSFSEDGTSWSEPRPTGLYGGDPACVALADGSKICIYVGPAKDGKERRPPQRTRSEPR